MSEVPETPAQQPVQQQAPAPIQQQQQPAQQLTQHSTNNGPQQLLDAINALPERITNSIREAVQPPKNTTHTPDARQQSAASQGNSAQSATADNSQKSNKSTSDSAASSTQAPGKKSFAEWWFKG